MKAQSTFLITHHTYMQGLLGLQTFILKKINQIELDVFFSHCFKFTLFVCFKKIVVFFPSMGGVKSYYS